MPNLQVKCQQDLIEVGRCAIRSTGGRYGDTDRIKASIETSNLADVLGRVLDKGVVIAGDIKIKLVDIELLTIQLRLVICSVDKAKEIGMDWWSEDSAFRKLTDPDPDPTELAQRVSRLEAQLAERSDPGG